MSIEELLQIRFMVVNPSSSWFTRYYEIIVNPDEKLMRWIYIFGCSDTFPTKDKMFVKLKWWEQRKLADMPKYVKSMQFSGSSRHDGVNKDVPVMYEVEEYTSSGFIEKGGSMYHWDTENFQPTTKEEYDYYKIGRKNYGEYWNNWYNNEYNKH